MAIMVLLLTGHTLESLERTWHSAEVCGGLELDIHIQVSYWLCDLG